MSGARLAAVLVALALGACSKIDYIKDTPVTGWSPTVVLMHRGGGNLCGEAPAPCYPNTLPAVERGFATLDGAEFDIELSQEGTLWLGHDNEVVDCAGSQVGCFQTMQDEAIRAVAYCDGASTCDPAALSPTCIQHYVTLDDVFGAVQGWTSDGTFPSSKLISLDIKGQYCGDTLLGADEARQIANEVDRLVRLYGLDFRVLTETSQLAFQDRIKELQTPVYSFVVSLGDIDGPLGAADRRGATGISFKYGEAGSEPVDASVVAGIHGSGFRIMLWTVDCPDDIAAAWAAQPDAIQTDEPEFFSCTTPGGACAVPACTP